MCSISIKLWKCTIIKISPPNTERERERKSGERRAERADRHKWRWAVIQKIIAKAQCVLSLFPSRSLTFLVCRLLRAARLVRFLSFYLSFFTILYRCLQSGLLYNFDIPQQLNLFNVENSVSTVDIIMMMGWKNYASAWHFFFLLFGLRESSDLGLASYHY